jgi:hypothetical protein
MIKARMIKGFLISAFTGFAILGFQNCAPTNFTAVPGTPVLSLSTENLEPEGIADQTAPLDFQIAEQNETPMAPIASETTSSPKQTLLEVEAEIPMEMAEVTPPAKEKTPEFVEEKSSEKPLEIAEEKSPEKPLEIAEEKSPEIAVVKPSEKAPEVAEEKSPEKTPEVTVAKTSTKLEDTDRECPNKGHGNASQREEGLQLLTAGTTEENLVECDLGRPNTKVILSKTLKSGSNSSSTRVCMSENACLKIVNAYAEKHDCSIAKNSGSGSSGSSGSHQKNEQCTAIFPGSRGTCKNATKVTDLEIAAILKSME